MKQVIGLALLGFCSTLYAGTLQENITQMDKFYARFEQQVIDDDLEMTRYHGEVWIERPNRFAWRQAYPNPMELIADGQHFITYDPELFQVIIKNQYTALADTPAAWLSREDTRWLNDFEIQEISGKGPCFSEQCYALTAKKEGEPFSQLLIGFEDGQLSEMAFEDALGQTTRFLFEGIQINQSFKTNPFEFHIPEGADVVDLS